MGGFGMFSGGMASPHVQRKLIIRTACASAVGATGYLTYRAVQQHHAEGKRLRLPIMAAEALSGAFGELVQIAALYPLDTIKVRCQSMGLGAPEIVKELLADGINVALVRKLYAGVLGTALCSLLVGSVHWVSFCTAKKTAMGVLAPTDAQGVAARAGSAHDDLELMMDEGQDSSMGTTRAIANTMAAIFSAVATAVVESPIELFRHNAQAGTMDANFLREMVTSLRRDGIGGLYWGFLPYCFEAWPYDITELLVYGHIKDLQEELKSDASKPWTQQVPQHVWDLSIGAASGTAAVLVSMPFDCIKTYMQTHGLECGGKGVLGAASVFLATGQRMVRKRGLNSLYVGIVPRLLQQVPASMICWLAIENCMRTLEPFTI